MYGPIGVWRVNFDAEEAAIAETRPQPALGVGLAAAQHASEVAR